MHLNSTYLTFVKSCLLVLGLLLFTSIVHAEGNCPEGYYPIGAEPGQNGPQGCAPVPGYNQAPPARWADQWGAIAVDSARMKAGAGVNKSNKEEAEQAALAECQSNGGARCKIELAYHNQCVAMTIGDETHNVTSDATADKATQASLKTCSAASGHCRVYYNACSLPKRIQ